MLQVIAEMQDVSINAIVNEAIDGWLEESEQQEVIEKFNLDRLDEMG